MEQTLSGVPCPTELTCAPLSRILDYEVMAVGNACYDMKFALVHELFHRCLYINDVDDDPYDGRNIMAYYSSTQIPACPTLRYRPLRLRYDTSLKECQWDTAHKY